MWAYSRDIHCSFAHGLSVSQSGLLDFGSQDTILLLSGPFGDFPCQEKGIRMMLEILFLLL